VERALGPAFNRLWAAYAASLLGTWLAFDAFPLIAILALDAGTAQVSLLASVGLVVGAALALPLGPWVEFRPKRPVMIATDLVRFAVLLSVPAAYLAGRLTFVQLLVVSVVVAAADIAFRAASGAYLKSLVPAGQLLVANGRFESTMWTASVLGPPLGGLLVGAAGPAATVLVNAASFLLSALGIRAIRGAEPPARTGPPQRLRPGDLLGGWRAILADPVLRRLFANAVLGNALIMAGAPVLAVLMLGRLGFAPWQYGLAFALPCLGGLLGSRLARPLVERFGERRVLLAAGTLRAGWPVGLALVGPGLPGLLLVIFVEFGLITCSGVFNPVYATTRLRRVPSDRVARVLTAWSITSSVTTAALVAGWGLLAAAVGPRPALLAAGVLLLATPLLLPWGGPLLRREATQDEAASVRP
jgi:MFS family permease